MKKLMNSLNFGLLIAFLAFSVNIYAQPANDECANAIDISAAFDGTCGTANLIGPYDNTGATGSPTDPPEPNGDITACPNGEDDGNLFGDGSTVMERSIWFTFTVPDLNGDGSPVTYSMWTSDGSYGNCGLNPNNILDGDADTQVAIYETNTCPDNTLGDCDYFAANEDLFNTIPWISGWLVLQFTPGQTYYMLIDSWDGVEGEICLAVVPCGSVCGDGEAAPVEDYCDCNEDFVNEPCPASNIYGIDEQTEINAISEDWSGNTWTCTPDGGVVITIGGADDNCVSTGLDLPVDLSIGNLFGQDGGVDTIPTGFYTNIELTPAELAVGQITIISMQPDGLGNDCSETVTLVFADLGINCVATCIAGDIGTAPLTVCQGGTIDLSTVGEDLTLDCPAGFTYEYAWRILGDQYMTGDVTQFDDFPFTDWIIGAPIITFNVDEFFIATTPNAPPNFTVGDTLIPADYYYIQGAALCVDANGNIDSGCLADGLINVTILDEDDPSCDAGVPGCTDPAFCEYDPLAEVDDGSCVTSNADPGTCDDGDCANGAETWDMDNCECVAGTPPTDLGCTDPAFCEFDPAATCDDGSCVTSNVDPGTCDDGDCTNGLETWDAATCTCVNNPPSGVTGCTDPAFCEYDPNADCDDGSCATSNADPGTCDDGDCTNGLETWDSVACACVPGTPSGNDGCTDPAFCEYDPNADCDDGSCTNALPTAATIGGGPFEFCVTDSIPDFVSGITNTGGSGTNGAWVITDDQLNILGLPPTPDVVDFSGAGLGTCLIWYVYFEDLTGAEVGMNAGNLGGCFALSNSIVVNRIDCSTCLGDIAGTILTGDPACDVSGTAVIIMDSDGNMIGTAIADADGNWSLAGGPYECGDYVATLDPASIPTCYSDAGGDAGPAGFTVGNGGVYGVDFNSFNEVPTLSQWGLMSLALLLMIFGALKLSTVSNVQLNRKDT